METSTSTEAAVAATIAAMTQAFAAGDVAGIMSTYEPGAVVVGAPGSAVRGEAALRTMFMQFIEKGIDFSYGGHEVVAAGDIALHLMQWTARSPDGERRALSVAVLRRQSDGGWRMVIDHPFGDGVMQAEPAAT